MVESIFAFLQLLSIFYMLAHLAKCKSALIKTPNLRIWHTDGGYIQVAQLMADRAARVTGKAHDI